MLVEPFFGGSHRQFIDLLVERLLAPSGANLTLATLPAKKWHWSMRTAALSLSERLPVLPAGGTPDAAATLFASSYTNLPELLALRPDLAHARKVLYFHENQLTYPTQLAEPRERDFQFGWIQVMSSLLADVVAFNSAFNMHSFLGAIDGFMRRIPDPEQRVLGLAERIRPKCRVLYFPLTLCPRLPPQGDTADPARRLQIVWNHRWEYDKCPEQFLDCLQRLEAGGGDFGVVMLGAAPSADPPAFFESHRQRLSAAGRLDWWGFAEDREQYLQLLRGADVAVSTAAHEFFGVAMLEAAFCGCYPLVPDSLVYPEIFAAEHRWKDPSDLVRRLRELCEGGGAGRVRRWRADASAREALRLGRFTWDCLRPAYADLLGVASEKKVL